VLEKQQLWASSHALSTGAENPKAAQVVFLWATRVLLASGLRMAGWVHLLGSGLSSVKWWKFCDIRLRFEESVWCDKRFAFRCDGFFHLLYSVLCTHQSQAFEFAYCKVILVSCM
jgi:hypothetical protein